MSIVRGEMLSRMSRVRVAVDKERLLEVMKELGACDPATKYVVNHPSLDAEVIWKECPHDGWRMWLAYRLIDRFSAREREVCNDRAIDFYQWLVDLWPEVEAALVRK